MKGKIITFFVGLLLGAIISTGSIYFYTVAINKNTNDNTSMQMPGGNDTMNQGGMQQGGNGQMGNPPEMPNQTQTN